MWNVDNGLCSPHKLFETFVFFPIIHWRCEAIFLQDVSKEGYKLSGIRYVPLRTSSLAWYSYLSVHLVTLATTWPSLSRYSWKPQKEIRWLTIRSVDVTLVCWLQGVVPASLPPPPVHLPPHPLRLSGDLPPIPASLRQILKDVHNMTPRVLCHKVRVSGSLL